MKKKITLLKVFMTLCLLLLSTNLAWGEVVSGKTYDTQSTTSLPAGWSGNGSGTSYIQLTASSNYIKTSEFSTKKITSIKLKARKYGGPSDEQAKITVSWYSGSQETVLGTVAPNSTTLTDYNISDIESVSGSGYVKIACKGASSSKGSGVSQVTITHEEASTKTLESISISGTPTKTAYQTDESFDVTGLTVTGTYDDSSTANLTDDAEWTINPATFTSTSQTSVSVTATVDGKTDTQSYDVTVNEHIVTPGTYEIVPNNTFFGIEAQTTGGHGPVTGKQNDITITHSGGSSSFYCNASQIRTYKDNTLTFSVPTGYEITSIILAVTDNASYNANVGTYTVSTKKWVGNANEVVLTSAQISGNYQITKITVTYIRNKTLDHITVTGTPESFFVGDEFKHNGMTVTAYYDDTTSEDVTSLATFSTPDMTEAGEKTVTVTYNNKETSYTINVQAVVLTSVEVSGEPTKKEYYVGESFNTAGLVVTGHYNNGTQATITEGITWTITPESFTDITETSVTVTAKVGNVTSTEYEVTGLTVTSPASAYTLTAEPAEGGSYTVIVGGDPAVDVTTEIKQLMVTEGTVIQVEATAAEHYKVHSTPFEGKYADETPIYFGNTGVANKKQFTYGTADATITAKFLQMYAVNIDENIEHGTVVADKLEETPNTGITLTLTPDAHYHFKSVTVTDKNGEDITLSEGPTTTDGITTAKFKMPSAEAKKGDVSVTATFEEDPKYTVTFSITGRLESKSNYAGEQVEFPEVSNVEDYTFMGWTDAPIIGTQQTAPEYVTSATYTEHNNTLYYAVFAKKSGSENYVKVTSTSDLTDGKYLIVYETGKVALNGALYADQASNTVSVEISNSEIESTNTIDAAAVTFKATNGSFLGGGGKYIGHTGSKNTLDYSDTAFENTVTFDDEGNAVIAAGSYVMRYNATSGQTRFRYYTSGQQAVQLYKKQEATYSNYCTTVSGQTVPVTIKSSGMGSFCSTVDLDFTNTDVKAYIAVDADNEQITLNRRNKIPAGTGIFVIGNEGTYNIPITTDECDNVTGNKLIGTIVPYTVKENDNIWVLSNGKLHPVKEGVTIGAGKAYLNESLNATSLSLFIIDEPTGVEEIKSQSTVNGQQSTAVYNLQGIRVTTPKKGEVYIMNGKKFLMK